MSTRKRGQVWLADLNGRRGTEPGRTRTVPIVQAQALLDVDLAADQSAFHNVTEAAVSQGETEQRRSLLTRQEVSVASLLRVNPFPPPAPLPTQF